MHGVKLEKHKVPSLGIHASTIQSNRLFQNMGSALPETATSFSWWRGLRYGDICQVRVLPWGRNTKDKQWDPPRHLSDTSVSACVTYSCHRDMNEGFCFSAKCREHLVWLPDLNSCFCGDCMWKTESSGGIWATFLSTQVCTERRCQSAAEWELCFTIY